MAAVTGTGMRSGLGAGQGAVRVPTGSGRAPVRSASGARGGGAGSLPAPARPPARGRATVPPAGGPGTGRGAGPAGRRSQRPWSGVARAPHYHLAVRVTRSSPPSAADRPGPAAPTGDPSPRPASSATAATAPDTGPAETAGRVPIELLLLVVAAVVVGIGVRFIARTPLWLDEALSVNIAKLPLGDIPEALHHDGHPPLYYLLLHGWMQVFGTGDTAVRALSGVISVLTLPIAYLAGTRLGGRRLGVLALGVFALNPFVVRYATETRMYALVTFLVLVAWVLVDDLVRRHRAGWPRVAALAVVVAALLYSHYWSMWLLAAAGTVIAVVWRRSADPDTRRGAFRALVATVAGGVLFLPWLPTLLYQSKHTGTPWAGPVRPAGVLGITFTDFGGGGFRDALFTGSLLLILVLLAVFGRARSARQIELDLGTVPQFRAEAAVVGLTLVLGVVVTYVTWSAFVTRYASGFLPLVLVLVAGGITRFTGRVVQAVVVVVVLTLSGMGCVYNIRFQRTQAAPIVEQITTKGAPGDVVVYCPDQLGPSTMRLMPDGFTQVGFPGTTSPERIDWVDYAARNAADPLAYAHTVADLAGPEHDIFVVWSGGYQTHEGTCQQFLGELHVLRPDQQELVAEDGITYYEHANLAYFPAP